MCVSPDWLLLVPLLFLVVVGLWLPLVLLFSGSSREGGRCLKASSLAMTCSWPHRAGLSSFEDSWRPRKRMRKEDIKILYHFTWEQWRSQDITDARAQHGHITCCTNLCAKCRSLRGGWGHPRPENFEILQLPRSVLRPAVAQCKSFTANMCMMSVWDIHSDRGLLRRSIQDHLVPIRDQQHYYQRQ